MTDQKLNYWDRESIHKQKLVELITKQCYFRRLYPVYIGWISLVHGYDMRLDKKWFVVTIKIADHQDSNDLDVFIEYGEPANLYPSVESFVGRWKGKITRLSDGLGLEITDGKKHFKLWLPWIAPDYEINPYYVEVLFSTNIIAARREFDTSACQLPKDIGDIVFSYCETTFITEFI